MTDYEKCLEAAEWRRKQLREAIPTVTAISTRRELVAETGRLERFARHCMLAKEFAEEGSE